MRKKGGKSIPADFRYREVFLKGKPQHDRFDPFRIRHPSMDRGRRAKIFAPFDALRGFREAIAAKDVPDSNEVQLSREEPDERRRPITHAE